MFDEQQLRSVVGAVLEVDPNSITDETSTDTVATWDSLRHMNLVLAVEETFDIVLPDDEIGTLTSYPLLRLVVRELTEQER